MSVVMSFSTSTVALASQNGAKTFKTSMRVGPDRKAARYRMAVDAHTCKVLALEEQQELIRNMEHRFIDGGPKDIHHQPGDQ